MLKVVEKFSKRTKHPISAKTGGYTMTNILEGYFEVKDEKRRAEFALPCLTDSYEYSFLEVLSDVKDLYDKSLPRKYSGYHAIVHPLDVAFVVSLATNDIRDVYIALLHDVMEDCEASLADVFLSLRNSELSEDDKAYVARGVVSLTDVYTKEAFPNKNRLSRRTLEAERLGLIAPSYQTIKYCDILCNIQSIRVEDTDFYEKTYRYEKTMALSKMERGMGFIKDYLTKELSV